MRPPLNGDKVLYRIMRLYVAYFLDLDERRTDSGMYWYAGYRMARWIKGIDATL